MQSGRLRHRVTLQRETVTRDTAGQEVVVWTTLATFWALVEVTRAAREGFVGQADQVQATADYRVTMRHRDTFTPDVKDRLVWNSIQMDIQNVVVDPVRRQWVVLCEAVV